MFYRRYMSLIMNLKSLQWYGRQSSSIIIGVCIGIALGLIQTPFIEDDCQKTSALGPFFNERLSKLRDLRSDWNGNDDYEPMLRLEKNYVVNSVDAKSLNSNQKLLRPRYFSTELGIRRKLVVAVLSSRDSIGTYGIAINRTLSQHVDKIIFFLDGIGSKKLGLNIPVVGFKDEKPLVMVFRVLAYLSENYLDDFDYFMLLPDRTYVHGRKINEILDRMSISENLHMGVPENNPESLYCSLDQGIILSHSVVRAVAGKLNWCMQNTYSETDTDNLGRCILHATDLPCTSQLQGQVYNSYQLRPDVEISVHLELIGRSSVVKETSSVSNIPNAMDMYVLHSFYLQEDIQLIQNRIEKDRREIKASRELMSFKIDEPTWPCGSQPAHSPATRFDVIRWDSFNATHIYLPNDFFNAKPMIGLDQLDIMSVVNASVAYMQHKSGGTLDYLRLEYGHRRLDPARGTDYIFSIIFRDNSSGQITSRKIEAARTLTEPEIVPMPYVTENSRITLVVPVLQDDIVDVADFLKRYKAECMVSGEHNFLMLVLVYMPGASSSGDAADVFKVLKDLCLKYTQEHYDSGSKVGWVAVHTPGQPPSPFALLDLVTRRLKDDDLVLVTTHNAHFTNDFLNRVRMNTILNWQVFSAVPFTSYHQALKTDGSSPQKIEVSRNVGHFDTYDFNHMSFYVTDYVQARKAVEETIPVVKTDKELRRDAVEEYEFDVYGLFLRATSLHVMRAPEPSLKLQYQDIKCHQQTLNDGDYMYKNCLLQQSQSLGLRTELSKLVLDYLNDSS